MAENIQVKDIMTKKVVTLKLEDSLEMALKMFGEYNYDGFPVVDSDGKLQGIVTEFDLLVKGSQNHMSIAYNLKDKDAEKTKDDFEQLKKINVFDVMTTDPLVIGPEASVEDLAKEFSQHHKVNPIPVIDNDKKLLGVVSRYDIIRFFNKQYFDDIREGKHGNVFRRLTNLDTK